MEAQALKTHKLPVGACPLTVVCLQEVVQTAGSGKALTGKSSLGHQNRFPRQCQGHEQDMALGSISCNDIIITPGGKQAIDFFHTPLVNVLFPESL